VAAGLWKSGFYTAMGACAVASGWFFLSRRIRWIHPAAVLVVMILAQAVVTAAPSIAARVHPSLEVRALMWRSGIDLLEEAGPMGTGTARSRLDLFVTGGDRLQILAGPERRVDFLHSEFLTLPVEQGVVGALAVLLFLLLVMKTRFSPARAAILLCCLPFAAADLPLATPLGAFPMAVGLAWAFSRGGGTVRIPRSLAVSAAVPATVWMVVVVAGSAAMQRGIEHGNAGRAREAAEDLALSSRLMPWEERSLFFQATAEAQASMPEEALGTISRFNAGYPGYWRAWALEGDLLVATGRGDEAPGAFLRALALAPAGTPSLGLIAFNAAAAVPEGRDSMEVLVRELILTGSQIPCDDPAILVEYAARASALATALGDPGGDLSSNLVEEVTSKLLMAASMQGSDAGEVETILDSLRPMIEGMSDIRRERISSIADSIVHLMSADTLDTAI
jgi:hypothetical protein